ncbi:hypothetical protein ACK2M2_11160 [Acinetobacter sp. TY1]|uniref:hypothetical protein n=1 Tax=Acinetobacter sp. TY1 TaxID=3387626 RepID=UPI003AF782D4
MFKTIISWCLSVIIILLFTWFLTWLHDVLGGSVFWIILLIFVVERAVNRNTEKIKSLSQRNSDLEDKITALSWEIHDLKNKD